MIALGIDPGPQHSGYALLRAPGGTARPTFVSGGTVASTRPALSQLLLRTAARWRVTDGVLLLAIETVEGYAHEHVRSKHLNATSEIAGLIRGLAFGPFREVCIPARRWRAGLCGKSNASDAAIKQALSVLVGNMPARSNAHVRDAMGVAFAAMQRPFEERTGT